MRQAVAEFAAFVNGARRFRRAVRADAARKRKLAEEAPQAGFVFAAVRIDFRVMSLEIAVRERRGCAVPWTGNVDHVQVELVDEPVQMHEQEALSRVRAPMSQQTILDVLRL